MSEIPEKASRPALRHSLSEVPVEAESHRPTGLGEFDRVLGGGLVPGVAVLLAGEPGVGKSTLLLGVAGQVARHNRAVLVASGEESVEQVGLRARRLGIAEPGVCLVSDRDTDAVLSAARALAPAVLMVDSVQTLGDGKDPAGAGSVTQVRRAAQALIEFAKGTATAVIVVGHVTKDGGIAGPKLLEHMVDVVLYLEGDHQRGLRVLRCLKNRFGVTNHVGLFELGDEGLRPVVDPSKALVGDWRGDVPGTVVFPAVEGNRPVLVEIQALVSDSVSPNPRRSVRGMEAARVHQLLAVLERHGGLSFAGRDVYVAVAGGLRAREPGADLPTALALASSLTSVPLGRTAAWGEVGLTGELRGVPHQEWRTEEANRLGIGSVLSPDRACPRMESALEAAGLMGDRAGLRREAV